MTILIIYDDSSKQEHKIFCKLQKDNINLASTKF